MLEGRLEANQILELGGLAAWRPPSHYFSSLLEISGRRTPSARVVQFVLKNLRKDVDSWGVDFWREHFDRDHFELEPDCVHIFGFGYPHAITCLVGGGPHVPYDVLLRDGYLKPDSPVRRAWEGVAPAAADKSWFPSGSEKELCK